MSDHTKLLEVTSDSLPSHNTTLLVVFIHGFKGTDQTFAQFPNRLQHMLTETIPGVSVECVIFPAYETKGELNEAVLRFSDWLTELTVKKENDCGGGSGSVKLILCGHSMGGLLMADTLFSFHKSARSKEPLWPRIIACIAFDTPFLGLHPTAFKNTLTEASQHVNTIGSMLLGSFAGVGAARATTNTSTSTSSTAGGWMKWAVPAGGALLAGAVAGGAYYMREDLNQGFAWGRDHLRYMSSLWEPDALKSRTRAMVNMENDNKILFRTFYVHIPVLDPLTEDRTFILLPERRHPAFAHFQPARNTIVRDAVKGHMAMFEASTNDGYYQLGLATAKMIQEAITLNS